MESYKMLLSDSGDQTSLPTCQVSKGLTGVASGTVGSLQACSTSPPAASLVCVNVMWLVSLVLSIASALFATLRQQWAPKYNRLPQVAMTVTLLLSLFLFLTGLVIFFFRGLQDSGHRCLNSGRTLCHVVSNVDHACLCGP